MRLVHGQVGTCTHAARTAATLHIHSLNPRAQGAVLAEAQQYPVHGGIEGERELLHGVPWYEGAGLQGLLPVTHPGEGGLLLFAPCPARTGFS